MWLDIMLPEGSVQCHEAGEAEEGERDQGPGNADEEAIVLAGGNSEVLQNIVARSLWETGVELLH